VGRSGFFSLKGISKSSAKRIAEFDEWENKKISPDFFAQIRRELPARSQRMEAFFLTRHKTSLGKIGVNFLFASRRSHFPPFQTRGNSHFPYS